MEENKMEFATLDKMVIELEKEKEVLDNRISDIKIYITKVRCL